MPNRSRERGDRRRRRRRCGSRTRSLPTLRLERLRRVDRDDLAVVDDRDAVAVLGLVHVVRREEDRDVLARACSSLM